MSNSPPFRPSLIWTSTLPVLFLFVKWLTATPRNKFPPGPKGIPFLGNIFQFRFGAEPWLIFTEWKKAHGPLVYVNMVGRHMLILNDHKTATDLLDSRGSIYSDRPRNIVGVEIMTRGMVLPATRYGDLWRRMRRASHEALNMSSVPGYYPIQQTEALLLALDLLKDPENWVEHIRRALASALSSMIYDTRPLESSADPAVATVNEMSVNLARASHPGAHLVEIFPILNYLPRSLAKWKREAEDFFSSHTKVFEDTYTGIQKRVFSGEEQRPSLCATLAETSTHHNMTNREAAWTAASIYVAGVDTSSTLIRWFMLAMTTFPDAQRKAQAELDDVVGRARPPSFSDLDHLPYVHALIREVLRWSSLVPIALPHQTTEDDWYEGYFIPKGTICIANVWAMNLDPDLFGPDTAAFNPSRHLDEQGKLKPSPETKDDGHFCFGFGRRICVGRNVAKSSSFINIATVIWALTIGPAKDSDGKHIEPGINACIDEGVIIRPSPFKCMITPRFPDVESILVQAKDEVLEKREIPLHVVKPIRL